MKQKDILMIVLAAIIGAAVSFGLSSVIISTPKNRQQSVEVVAPISSNFPAPDARFMGPGSINPTRQIQIGNNANTKPFSTSP